jgi:hypothetical protein
VRAEREQACFRLHLVKHRSMLKHRIHATLITFGHPCPVGGLFGVAGRELLDRLAIPEPRRGTGASLTLIDDLDAGIDLVNRQLRLGGADHPYIPLLLTVPGIGAPRRLTTTATSPPSASSASTEAPESPRSTLPDGSPKPSGTCSLATSPSLRQAPLFVWPRDRSFGLAPPERTFPCRPILPPRRP